MKRRRLRKKEAKRVAEEMRQYGFEVQGDMDEVEFKTLKVILVDSEPLLLEFDGRHYFTLFGLLRFRPEKGKVTVDNGALPYIMNGADVMKPGIVYADENIKESDFVYVTVEGKESPIAVGVALVDGPDMMGEKGKAVRTIHHLKDDIWNFFSK